MIIFLILYKAATLYQINRHELIEAAAGSQDAIEVFLSHKVNPQNLMKLSLDDDIDDAVRFLGGKINPVGHQDYDKAFTSEYWNRMKIRDTLLVIGKVRHQLKALIKPLIRTFRSKMLRCHPHRRSTCGDSFTVI